MIYCLVPNAVLALYILVIHFKTNNKSIKKTEKLKPLLIRLLVFSLYRGGKAVWR